MAPDRSRIPPVVIFAAIAALLAFAIMLGRLSALGDYSLCALATRYYWGDLFVVLAWMKAYSVGEVWPFLVKDIASLGAPFGANWTDYPAEDLLMFAGGLLTRAFGLWLGSGLLVLLLQILAGVAFFLTGTALGYRRSIVFAAALLFGLAPFAFTRNLGHLTLAAYWHVPLALFAIKWAAGDVRSDISCRAQRALAATGAVLAGLLNPYYLGAFLWLGACTLAGSIAARRRRDVLATCAILGLAVAAFAIESLDSLWMIAKYGPNREAIVRSLGDLDTYGLRLPDLAFPYIHRSDAIQAWSDRLYQTVAPGGRDRGEAARSYLGLVSCAALFLLLAAGTARVAARQFARVSDWYWMALATIAFAVVGGVNYFLGAFGLVFLRATTRLSIVIMAIALFWLCEALSRTRNRGIAPILAVLIIAVGYWDQVVPASLQPKTRAVDARTDARFVEALESVLPPGAMVLQLPLKQFPESGPVHQMSDYEHLRPYLHSRSLRFSYGTIKGRSDSDWQAELQKLPVAELATRAATYGFSAVYVNRRAYVDGARGLEAQLKEQLGQPIATNADLVAYRLPPAANPVLPPLNPKIEYEGFAATESNGVHSWNWATSHAASLTIRRPYRPFGEVSRSDYEVTFDIEPANSGDVTVSVDGRASTVVKATERAKPVKVVLHADEKSVRLDLRSERPPQPMGHGGGWNDATRGEFPDWIQVAFEGPKVIDRVVVYTLQDDFAGGPEPNDALRFTRYGIKDFAVEGWNGSGWVQLGTVRGNSLVKRPVTFAPFTTDKIRVVVNDALDGYSRITEIEAWTVGSGATPPANVALSSAGSVASASSTMRSAYPATAVIDDERAGRNWGNENPRRVGFRVSDLRIREIGH